MSKKDYQRAAEIAQDFSPDGRGHEDVTEAFIELFRNDNERFDEARFRAACIPGANIKARSVRTGGL